MVTGKQYQQGIALLQVLLMSAVISVLALQMSYSARDKVAVAQAIQDKVMAETHARTIQSELLYALTTERWVKDDKRENSIVQSWNFYGKAFEFDKRSTIKIQDNSGLISVFNGGEPAMIERAFTILLGDAHKARMARRAIIDQQGFRAGSGGHELAGQFFQSRYEMLQALETQGIQPGKAKLFTRIPYSAFLPLQAPDDALRLWLPERQAEAVISAREHGELTPAYFSRLTGLHKSDDMLFIPSGRFMIELQTEEGEARVIKKMFINVSPTNKSQPIWSFGVEG